MTQHNFSAGPGALPPSVLEEASRALIELPDTRLSVLGMSHRSDWFRDVVAEATANIRTLLALPDAYDVLFLQGGGTTQFSMVPMALLRGRSHAAEYLHTGYWSGKSIVEARREGPVRVLWSGERDRFQRLPSEEDLAFSKDAPYFHYVSNETVEGVQFHRVPGRDDVLRVCDMSSDILSGPIDVTRFALIYAHAQKNLGPSGVTLVVLRRDVVDRAPKDLPSMLDYRPHLENKSVFNTPPVFAIYVVMLVTRWLLRDVGGLAAMRARNEAKAHALYRAIDGSDGFYAAHVDEKDRSLMNVVFRLPSPELDARFVDEAEAAGLHGLAGHRTIGGIRASLYNAVTLESVNLLCAFMADFSRRHRA